MYFIYENWRAARKAKIHMASCSFCNNGMGRVKDKRHGDENGKWPGPYQTFAEAYKIACSLPNREVSECGHCTPSAAQ